ncbi:MAG: TldD/PmbA family protein [Dictyoglomaceae bacterium]
MIEKLVEIGKKYADEVEVYQVNNFSSDISFENGVLKDIESSIQSGISLRIIKDGKLGFSYTKNLLDPEEFVKNAVESLKGDIKVEFSLPTKNNLKTLSTYDPEIENLTNTKMVEEGQRVSDILSQATNTQINVGMVKSISEIRIINSHGVDYSTKYSFYMCYAAAMYSGSYASITRAVVDKKFKEFSKEDLDYITFLYNSSRKEVKPKGGRLKVIFLPNTMYVLIWRLNYATNGKNVYERTSPLIDKIGSQIFDSAINIYDDPFDESLPGARPFDDEGVETKLLPIVEKGVLKNFYYDLYYGSKMKVESTGNGYRVSDWSGESIRVRPTPALEHLHIQPGDKDFYDLIKSMDQGIIVAGALGAHSGNIPNGDFSIGLSPGLYVENGEIVGHVKDAMVAGNIYEVMKNVIGIENRAYISNMGVFPSVLFDNVSVAVKD